MPLYLLEKLHYPYKPVIEIKVKNAHTGGVGGGKQTQKIHIYDGRGNSQPLYLLEKLHYKPVIEIKVKNKLLRKKLVYSTGDLITQ